MKIIKYRKSLLHISFVLALSSLNLSAETGDLVSTDASTIGSKSSPEIDLPHKHASFVYKELNGKTIGNIEIDVHEIFDDPDIGSAYQSVNSVKVNTRQEVIRRELLFKEGEPFDAFLLHESERILRELRYLRRVEIVPTENGGVVNIKVTVQDTWTLIPQISYSSGSGRKKQAVGISESNIAGLGKRGELLYEEDERRSTVEAVYEDSRVWGTSNRLLAAYFDRSDGQRNVIVFGRPFRSLIDKTAWSVSSDVSDSVGRLFENSNERYIFRQKNTELSARYTLSRGDPERSLSRYSLGYDFQHSKFSQASQNDYDSLGLDPAVVSNDLTELPKDRRFTGPLLTYEDIDPNYISMNYIDRFDRVADYNLGTQYSLSFFLAPAFLGSVEDTLLYSGNVSQGYQFNNHSFIRGEAGIASRLDSNGSSNTLARFETKYYDVLGPKYIRNFFVGRHTLAADFFLDYGAKLDGDRQFLVGGDNVLRGYRARTFAGDKRFGLNFEDRVHLVDDLFHLVSLGAATFLDVGGASNKSMETLFADKIYSDVGFGLRVAFPRSAGGSILRADIALPLRDGPDGSARFQVRLIFNGGQLFDSTLRSESIGPEKANVSIGLDR